ncbi:2OG-Fe(II) oxygenase [Sinomicrobium weinanense]|uniref:2OG-Fe(II) oxygenase n=1 Tax=Sinomicrobium weinanense TaxID=2842200 RepID=A0A926JT22_9FLAO|nr:2OG-Fe(II) oxygenase [Sinomicrobium weinanense]MBU3124014.1 2OG-Fe(II) oxygenase [Sinomicrobium weinanense]
MNELFEQLDFTEDPCYEKIIADLLERQYSIVEDFFPAGDVIALRHALLDKYEEDRFKKAAIGNRVNEVIEKTVRGDFILWLNEACANTAEELFFSKINHFVSYLNKTCFLGILHKEFHYAIYPKGTFYKRHLDTFQNDDRRKLSMVFYLNEENWQPEYGGELVLYKEEHGKECPVTIYPYPGRMVIFESQVLEHEVRPVERERLSITGWLKTS